MTRAQAADALARSTAFWSQLLAEAEAEAARHFEEVQQLRAALAQVKSAAAAEALGLADKVKAARAEAETLRAKLREEERVRAESQQVDAAARRYVAALGSARKDAPGELDALIASIAGSRDPAIRTGECCAEMRARAGGGFPFPVHFCPFCGAPQ